MNILGSKDTGSKGTDDHRFLAAGIVGAVALLVIAAILMSGTPSANRGSRAMPLLLRLAPRRSRRPELDAHAAAVRRQLSQMASAIAGGLHEARMSVEAAVSDLARHWDRRQSSGAGRRS